jgi:preprotein translocase subunit SecB
MGHRLPEMSAPPVSEVVCGVRFPALPLDPIDFGALWHERG